MDNSLHFRHRPRMWPPLLKPGEAPYQLCSTEHEQVGKKVDIRINWVNYTAGRPFRNITDPFQHAVPAMILEQALAWHRTTNANDQYFKATGKKLGLRPVVCASLFSKDGKYGVLIHWSTGEVIIDSGPVFDTEDQARAARSTFGYTVAKSSWVTTTL